MRFKIVGLATVVVSLAIGTASWGAAPTMPAPSSWTLTARGNVSQGVTVKPVMKKRRTIGLVVFKQPKHVAVVTVLLGTVAGTPSIHWNLKVRGKLLGTGSYQLNLRVFANGKPAAIPGPPPRSLVISGTRVSVR